MRSVRLRRQSKNRTGKPIVSSQEMVNRMNEQMLRKAFRRSFEAAQKDGLFLGGHLELIQNGQVIEVAPNLITNEGIEYLLDTGLFGAAQNTAWYFAPYANNVAASATATAATFNATYAEVTQYDETNRPAWTKTRADRTVSNAGALTLTTFNANGLTVRGTGIVSVSTKGSASGVLLAIATLGTPKTGLGIGDALSYLYTFTGTTA